MIRAVARALSILEVFDVQNPNLSLQEISERIGMAKATAFRFVSTLEQTGYLIRGDDQRYSLSLKFVRLAGFVRSNISIREIAKPTMTRLHAATRETTTLNIAAGAERICLAVMDSPSPLMSIVQTGEHLPLAFGATGRILLAHMSDEQVDAVVESQSEPIDRVALDRELARFRRQGYALTRSQRVLGVTAIARRYSMPRVARTTASH